MVGVFSDDEVGNEVEAGEAAYEWSCGCGGEDRRLVGGIFKANFDAFDELANATSGYVVEEFGDFVTDDVVGVGVGFVFGRKESLFLGLESVEAFDATVVFSFGLFSFCGVGLLLRGGCFVVGGGLGLFWLFESLQEKLQLVGVKLFAAFSKETARECVEFFPQEGDFSLKLGDALVFFVGRFDAIEIILSSARLREF